MTVIVMLLKILHGHVKKQNPWTKDLIDNEFCIISFQLLFGRFQSLIDIFFFFYFLSFLLFGLSKVCRILTYFYIKHPLENVFKCGLYFNNHFVTRSTYTQMRNVYNSMTPLHTFGTAFWPDLRATVEYEALSSCL